MQLWLAMTVINQDNDAFRKSEILISVSSDCTSLEKCCDATDGNKKNRKSVLQVFL